jgi:hypothetical protein
MVELEDKPPRRQERQEKKRKMPSISLFFLAFLPPWRFI